MSSIPHSQNKARGVFYLKENDKTIVKLTYS